MTATRGRPLGDRGEHLPDPGGHGLTAFGQLEAGQPAVEDPVGVEDLAVT